MLWTLAFDRLGVAVSDLYFVDPNGVATGDGERVPESAERGVRVELRMFERDELKGSPYSAVPIRVDAPIWRIDLLEAVESEPGALDRAHHHPRFHDWDPGRRVFDEELSADPVTWVGKRFAEIETVLEDAKVDRAEIPDTDIESMRNAAPMIVGVVEHLLGEVAAGRAGLAPPQHDGFVRQSWL